MKRRNKVFAVFIAFVLLMGTMTGCRQEFAAKKYVEAMLETVLTGQADNIKQFASADEVEKLKSKHEALIAHIDSYSVNIAGDNSTEFGSIVEGYLKKVRYSIQDPVKVEDGCKIDVVIEPIIFFDGVFSRLQVEATEYLLEYQDEMDESEVSEWLMEKTAEILREIG